MPKGPNGRGIVQIQNVNASHVLGGLQTRRRRSERFGRLRNAPRNIRLKMWPSSAFKKLQFFCAQQWHPTCDFFHCFENAVMCYSSASDGFHALSIGCKALQLFSNVINVFFDFQCFSCVPIVFRVHQCPRWLSLGFRKDQNGIGGLQ